MGRDDVVLEVDGREVKVSGPDKILFPDGRHTKLDLCEYYLAVADPLLRHLRDRPTTIKCFPDGAGADFFSQKRLPKGAPEWLEQMTLSSPRGPEADFLVVQDRAHLVWGLDLGVIDWNPWPVRRPDGDHPDELRIDLDPTPGSSKWSDVRDVALCVREVLTEHGLVGYPKTSGSRGIHVYVGIERRWDFTEVRSAALALAREVERRMPGRATSEWWKEERVGVFLDYNQNARDRTIASAYSVLPNPGAWVSAPLEWDEVPDAELDDFRLDTVPARLAERGDPSAGLHEAAGSLDGLLDLAARDEAAGLGDAPWPPHYG